MAFGSIDQVPRNIFLPALSSVLHKQQDISLDKVLALYSIVSSIPMRLFLLRLCLQVYRLTKLNQSVEQLYFIYISFYSEVQKADTFKWKEIVTTW